MSKVWLSPEVALFLHVETCSIVRLDSLFIRLCGRVSVFVALVACGSISHLPVPPDAGQPHSDDYYSGHGGFLGFSNPVEVVRGSRWSSFPTVSVDRHGIVHMVYREASQHDIDDTGKLMLTTSRDGIRWTDSEVVYEAEGADPRDPLLIIDTATDTKGIYHWQAS